MNSIQEWDFYEYDYMPEKIANRDDTSEFFLEKFKEELAKRIPPSTFSEIRMDRMLKGIVEHGDVIHVFFDMTALSQTDNAESTEEGAEGIWATIHELYNLRKIMATEVSRSIESLFYHNPYLLKIKGETEGGTVDTPYILFLCDKTDGFTGSTIVNVEHSDSIYIPRVKDDRLGDFFWFSSTPIQGGSDPRKYAVFIDEHNTRFFQKGEEISFTPIEGEKSSIEDFESIYFYEGDIQIWCIKSRMAIIPV